MASVNKVIIVGHLGANPELKYLASGQAVCSMSVATSEQWTDNAGQKQERTEWHRVSIWGRAAEACGKYLEKGKMVYLEGSLRTDSWEDKETGQKKYATKIMARDVRFLSPRTDSGGRQERSESRPSGGGGGGGDTQRQENGPEWGPGDEDIPF